MQANHNRKCSGLYSAAILAEPAQSSFIVRVDNSVSWVLGLNSSTGVKI
jgi:hypothetical protein